MNDPASIGDKEIESIKNHWKNYTSKKTWGNEEATQEKPTSTQDVSRENVKNSKEDVVNKTKKEKTTTTTSAVKETVEESVKKTVETAQKVSTQDLVREATEKSQKNVVKSTGKHNINNIKIPKYNTPEAIPGAATPMQAKILKSAPKIMKGAALFIGTTAILSKGLDMSEKAEQKAQTREMEKSAKKKVKEEKKKREDYKVQNAYGKIDTSGIVMEMFEQRIGHHKMGNSRF